jgi:DNA processing protein
LSSCNLEKTLAIVGSRKISNYCKDTLNKIVQDIPDKRITIISGMALGADACAHRAALENNIKTIAVLGSGFDHVYPRENKDIYNKILEGNGAVLSEYYPDLQPMPWMFPHRNRIVSGLSKGVLVAEAAAKSGALITAKLALEQNRDIMCIRG